MNRSLPQTVCITLVLFTASVVVAGAQQPKTPETSATSAPTAPATQAPATPTPLPAARFDRLAAAKTIYIKNGSENDIPYNVISTAFEGWGHYIVVDDPDKAELVMEISLTGGESSVKVSESGKNSMHTGKQEESHSTTKEITPEVIKITVYDKNKRPIWLAREEPKFAVRHKAAENNLVEAAQRLFARFHDRVEPPPKP